MVDAMSQALSKMLNEYTFDVEEKIEALPFALQTENEGYGEVYVDW